jgi:hypothetical protein
LTTSIQEEETHGASLRKSPRFPQPQTTIHWETHVRLEGNGGTPSCPACGAALKPSVLEAVYCWDTPADMKEEKLIEYVRRFYGKVLEKSIDVTFEGCKHEAPGHTQTVTAEDVEKVLKEET